MGDNNKNNQSNVSSNDPHNMSSIQANPFKGLTGKIKSKFTKQEGEQAGTSNRLELPRTETPEKKGMLRQFGSKMWGKSKEISKAGWSHLKFAYNETKLLSQQLPQPFKTALGRYGLNPDEPSLKTLILQGVLDYSGGSILMSVGGGALVNEDVIGTLNTELKGTVTDQGNKILAVKNINGVIMKAVYIKATGKSAWINYVVPGETEKTKSKLIELLNKALPGAEGRKTSMNKAVDAHYEKIYNHMKDNDISNEWITDTIKNYYTKAFNNMKNNNLIDEETHTELISFVPELFLANGDDVTLEKEYESEVLANKIHDAVVLLNTRDYISEGTSQVIDADAMSDLWKIVAWDLSDDGIMGPDDFDDHPISDGVYVTDLWDGTRIETTIANYDTAENLVSFKLTATKANGDETVLEFVEDCPEFQCGADGGVYEECTKCDLNSQITNFEAGLNNQGRFDIKFTINDGDTEFGHVFLDKYADLLGTSLSLEVAT
jgi:hypothetical protein